MSLYNRPSILPIASDNCFFRSLGAIFLILLISGRAAKHDMILVTCLVHFRYTKELDLLIYAFLAFGLRRLDFAIMSKLELLNQLARPASKARIILSNCPTIVSISEGPQCLIKVVYLHVGMPYNRECL